MEEIPPVPTNFIGLARELMGLVRFQDVAGGINSSSVLLVLNEEANFFLRAMTASDSLVYSAFCGVLTSPLFGYYFTQLSLKSRINLAPVKYNKAPMVA